MPEEPAVDNLPGSRRVLVVADEEAGQRLDRYLATHLAALSRTRLQGLVDQGRVEVDGVPRKRSHRLEPGQTILVRVPPAPPRQPLPEAIPLEVLYEDEDVAVVNKPAGMIVHPGALASGGTLVNALLHRFGRLSKLGGELRPGIVHRLDRGTSGALLIARNDAAHERLAEQFRSRQVAKTYVALLHGRLRLESGRIELPVSRDLRRRARMTARRREGRPARTDWRVLQRLDGFTLIEADLHTGRTHQLRVHFSALGHPVVGDTLYGAPRQVRAGAVLLPQLGRNFLHAARIGFLHPSRNTPMEVRAPLPAELVEFFRAAATATGAQSVPVDAVLREFL
jgi:23S rRNA pseudouridine1911/1915/1917 synthase